MTDVEKIIYSSESKNKEWTKFYELIEKNLNDVEKSLEEGEERCKRLENTISHIKELSKHAQARSYVKICSLAYVLVNVKHTGEYNVELSDYQCTLTKDQTVHYLEKQLAGEKSTVNMYKSEKDQLERRLDYNFIEKGDVDVTEMPSKIITKQGIAYKQGSFFEIVEEEPNEPYVKNRKRISRVKDDLLVNQCQKLSIT